MQGPCLLLLRTVLKKTPWDSLLAFEDHCSQMAFHIFKRTRTTWPCLSAIVFLENLNPSFRTDFTSLNIYNIKNEGLPS